MTVLIRTLVVLACMALAAALAVAVIDLPPPAAPLRDLVMRDLDRSGVRHPVTAVLLNFRAYDTLLEIAVLLLAGLGVLAGGGVRLPGVQLSSRQGMLAGLTRWLAPAIVLAAVYVLWSGAHAPGGAFQAAALLGAGGVLLSLAGMGGTWADPAAALRIALAAGFLVFMAVAALGLANGGLLAYPAGSAGALILLIEAALTVSLALLLTGLFLWQPNQTQEER